MAKAKQFSSKVSIDNRKARHKFQIFETFEAGIVLQGCEVKSIRMGEASLAEGYAHVRSGELYLEGMHINPYPYTHQDQPDPIRTRKLLMSKREIAKLKQDIEQKGLTLVPLKLYAKKGKIKVALGLAKGKSHVDKRHSLKAKDIERKLNRINRSR